MDAVQLQRNLAERINLADMLRRSAAAYGQKTALIDPYETASYSDLNRDVNTIASQLLASGVVRGEFVALLFKNSIDYFRLFFACSRIGAVALPLNPNLSVREYEHICKETTPRLLFVHGDLDHIAREVVGVVDSFEKVIATSPGGKRPDLTDFPARIEVAELSDFVAERGAEDYDSYLQTYLREVERYVDDRDAAQCIYTSGTTSAPKGVITSHKAAMFAAVSVAHHMRVTNEDVCLVLLPVHHVAGSNDSTFAYLMAGATTVLLEGWDATRVAEALQAHSITVSMLTGPMLMELSERNDSGQYDWSSVRLFVVGISALPPERADRLRELCPRVRMLPASGMTEFTGYQEALNPRHERTKADAWGDPTLMTDIAIMAESGALLPPGEVGEIVYRGPQCMTGYLGEEKMTRAAFAHGWFHSGDLGYVDDDHTVFFVDRKKDMIKTGGENVASMEVKEAIMGHPDVADCAVVGLPHPRWSEAVTAFVKPREGVSPSEESLRQHCEARLARFKVPKRIVFVDDFPRTASGKIRNVELRETYADLFVSPEG